MQHNAELCACCQTMFGEMTQVWCLADSSKGGTATAIYLAVMHSGSLHRACTNLAATCLPSVPLVAQKRASTIGMSLNDQLLWECLQD